MTTFKVSRSPTHCNSHRYSRVTNKIMYLSIGDAAFVEI